MQLEQALEFLSTYFFVKEKLSSSAMIVRPLLMGSLDPCKRYWVPDGAFVGLPPRELGAEVPLISPAILGLCKTHSTFPCPGQGKPGVLGMHLKVGRGGRGDTE